MELTLTNPCVSQPPRGPQGERAPVINPRTVGGLSHLRTAGGADDRPPPPENSKTNKDNDKR